MAPPSYLALLTSLVDADPDNPTLQRLAFAAATATDTGPERGPALSAVLRAPGPLPEDIAEALRNDPNQWVRTTAWSRPEVTADMLAVMLTKETSSMVRRTTLRHRGLPEDLYRAAAPRRERHVKPTTAANGYRDEVLTNAAHLPASLVREAIDALSKTPQAPSYFAVDAATLPGVAGHVAAGDGHWLLRLAAATSPEVAEATVVAILDGLPDPSRKDHAPSRLLTQLAGRADLSDVLYRRIREVVPAWSRAGTIPADFPDRVDALDAVQRLLDHLDGDANGDLLALWQQLPEPERTVELAERVLTCGPCCDATFAAVEPYLTDPTDAGLVEVFTRRGARVRDAGWTERYPRLTARRIYRQNPTYRERLLEDLAARLEPQVAADVAAEVVNRYVAGDVVHDARFPGQVWQQTVSHLPVDPVALTRIGFAELVAAVRNSLDAPRMRAAVAAAVGLLLDEYPQVAVQGDLVELLSGSPAPAREVFAAAAAASGS